MKVTIILIVLMILCTIGAVFEGLAASFPTQLIQLNGLLVMALTVVLLVLSLKSATDILRND